MNRQRIVEWLLALVLGSQACAVHAQQTVKYVHTDALGSVVAMTDAAGAVVETTREYEPYGQQLAPAIQDGPGYTGQVQDAATGLTYMQQRYYDPQLGEFLSVDPVTAYQQPITNFCRYCYARNNPYKFTDPDGRQSRENVQVQSTGVPLFDWILSPSDARGSHSQMVKEQLTAELSQPHSVRDIALYVAIAMSAGTGAAGSLGRTSSARNAPTEAYNRAKHYGRTPTAADRRAVGAGDGQVADHDPPLVRRYYEGDPSRGERPGYQMTGAERRESAQDRSRMRVQSSEDSNRQGAEMSRYSREKKRENDL